MMSYTVYNSLVEQTLAGAHTSPRGLETYEMPSSIVFVSPCSATILRRRMNMRLAVVESLMLVAGIFSIDAIKEVAPNANLELYKTQSDYGPRTRDQMQGILNLLIRDPSTRRAVLYFNTDRHFGSNDLACTTSIQWVIRDSKMKAYVTVRSWDLAYGLPMDVMMYGMLTQALARAVGVDATMMYVSASCVHIYESTKHLAHSIGSLHHVLGDRWGRNNRDWRTTQRVALDALARVLTDANDIEDFVMVTPIEEVTQDELHSSTRAY